MSTGNWMPGCGSGMLPWATARMSAGGWRRSRARSVLVTTTAQAPSVSRQKSKSRSGREIIRADEVVVHRQRAVVHLRRGLALARARHVTAMLAELLGSVVPNSIMWRWAMRAKIWPGVSSPYGAKNSSYVPAPPTRALRLRRRARSAGLTGR